MSWHIIYSWKFYMCTWEECIFYRIWIECCYSKYVPQNKACKINFTQKAFWFFFLQNLCAHRNLMKFYLYQNYNPAWFLLTVKLEKCQSGTGFLTFSSWQMRLGNHLYWVLWVCSSIASDIDKYLKGKIISGWEPMTYSWNTEVSWQNSDQSPFLPQFEPFNKSFNCFRHTYFCGGK